ncbi:MAG TPA: M67 family metallopeptidase [Clostridia bacterium]|nr:M67 family metallopeptidase [Clostridia bacterium]
MLIAKEDYREIVRDCIDASPYEACGLISGYRVDSGLTVVANRVYPARNLDGSATSYRVSPEDQIRIMLDMENEGFELVGIYHSHPDGRAYPSLTDVEQAFYPEAVYLIVGMKDGIEVRGYHIENPRLAEVLRNKTRSRLRSVVDVEILVKDDPA